MPEENFPERPLKTDFFAHQAEATHTPITKQPVFMAVLLIIGIGVLCGLFQFGNYLLNFDKLAAMKNVEVHLKNPLEQDHIAFIDVEIVNYNPAPIKDTSVKYSIKSSTGSSSKDGTVTLAAVVPAGDTRVFPHVSLGALSAQSGHMQAELGDLRYGPKPNLSPELSAKFIEAANLEPKNSLDAWTEFVKSAPEFAPGYIQLGQALSANDDLDNAIKAFEKSLKMDPDDANAHYNLGIAYFYKKDNSKSKQEFEAAAKLEPDDPAVKESLQRFDVQPTKKTSSPHKS